MKNQVVRVIGMLALAGMALAACAAPTATTETEAPVAAPSTAEPVETEQSPTEGATLELIGTIEQMAPEAWTLNGQVLAILPQTEIQGSFQVGDMVRAHAVIQSDGSLAAREISPVEAADATTMVGAEFDFTGAVEAMAVDEWTVAGTTFAVTSQTEIKDTFFIGDLVKVHVVVGVDGALVAREIEAPGAGLEGALEGTEIELVAVIDSVASDTWVIGGWALAITPQTEIKGAFAVGDAVKVHVLVGAGGTLVAREIEAAEVGDVGGLDDNSNASSNANENENLNGNTNGNSNENDDDSGGGNSNNSGSGG